MALRAFGLLAERLPGAELHVFGHDHGEGEAAQRWWQHSGLTGSVRFFGAVKHEDLLSELAEADVLMHASLEESFGMVLAEALAAAVPVVAGARSGAAPWVIGQAGSLVDVTRAQDIARELHRLLTDPAESDRLGQLGRAQVRERFCATAVAAAYELEYAKALSAAPRSLGIAA